MKENGDVFGERYANAYDLLYADKDYDAEVDAIESLWRRYGNAPVRTVLDLGCGTGNHALPLAARGYDVVGVDRAPAMLAHAEAKARARGLSIGWREGDLRNLALDRRFDAAIMMFAVLGYFSTYADLHAVLTAVRRHLADDSLFLFDVWYGPAVLVQRPGDRVKFAPCEGGRILRIAHADLDTRAQLCTVEFHLMRFAGDRVVEETEERHTMRFFFAQELELLLAWAGFSLLRLGAFPTAQKDPNETTWNVMAVARATSFPSS